MAKRVCSELGCPAITDQPRCPKHMRERDKARGSRQARGYDAAHDRLRAAYQRAIDDGERVTCWRPDCTAILSGRAWHLGHDDNDRTITRGPECIPCNLKHAGAKRTYPT